MASLTQTNMSLSKLREIVRDQGSLACCHPWGRRVGHDLANEKLYIYVYIYIYICNVISFSYKKEQN